MFFPAQMHVVDIRAGAVHIAGPAMVGGGLSILSAMLASLFVGHLQLLVVALAYEMRIIGYFAGTLHVA